jgi:23S rRNA (adenine2503-C2)-methyltransferase
MEPKFPGPPNVPSPVDPRSMLPADLFALGAQAGMSEETVRRWAGAVIGRGEYRALPVMSESHIAKRFSHLVADLPALLLTSHLRSQKDGFEKLLFTTSDGMKIETVIIPLQKEGSVSLCLSSQVGCVMGCTFCATARMPTRRNLSSWEILDQFIQARKLVRASGRRVTGAVFMGMGEPFLNFTNVITAASWLHFPVENAISGKAITISTVGLVEEIERFTSMKLPFRLSISLGAATDEKRRRLVPVAARTPIATVMEAARKHALTRRDRVNLSYVCIRGENVSEDDARALSDLIGDTPVRLDLIDVTDHSGRYEPPSTEELRAFRDALSTYLKQPVARRYSGGADIKASCGSLAGGA